jgi:hypothetical protein
MIGKAQQRRAPRVDAELEEFRNLMTVPDKFEEGFTWGSLVAALFVAILLVPGAMYMQLMAGTGVGPAAQWVTVILFLEVARRAHRTLPRPQVFVLYNMAAAVMAEPFSGMLYNPFFVRSRAAIGMGVAEALPSWVAPNDPDILAQRNFFMRAWMPAIALVIFQKVLGRLNSTVLSYGFFRLASDIERLPFPMAPIGAQGVLALVEQQTEEGAHGKSQAGNWRWRVFSVGGSIGLVFGALYMGLPAISGALLGEPIVLLPIPFVDFTQKTGSFLPAVATGLTLDLGQFIVGMVLPFWAMLGSAAGWTLTAIGSPLLYRAGILTSWELGDETVATLFKNNVDFFFSFSIGICLALAIVGLAQVYRGISRHVREARRAAADAPPAGPPPGRGDFPAWMIIAVYAFTSLIYISVSGYLVNWHRGVMIVLLFFAYLYTPLISYVTARLEGMVGQVVDIPFVREASFILSGYRGGVSVWFLPLPLSNFGQGTVFWRKTELTGTKFTSIWKTELILVPIVLVASIFFAQFIWSLGPIPGPDYPFAERMWEFNAANQCIIYSSTLGRFSTFEQAFRPIYIACGTAIGLLLFSVTSLLAAPAMLSYGLVRGLNQTMPHVVLMQFAGALLGRFYFRRRFGKQWRQYIPVVGAGFSCGMGLITIFAVGINFLSKSVIKIPF